MNEIIENVYEKFKIYAKSGNFISLEGDLKRNIMKTNDIEHNFQKLICSILRQTLLNVHKLQNIETNIFTAVGNNDFKSVQFLIENHANVNKVCQEGSKLFTPLIYLCETLIFY